MKIGDLKNAWGDNGDVGLDEGDVDAGTKEDLETWSGDLDAFGAMVIGCVLAGGGLTF